MNYYVEEIVKAFEQYYKLLLKIRKLIDNMY